LQKYTENQPRRSPAEGGSGRSWSTERKVQLGFAFALICLAVAGAIGYISLLRLEDDAARVEHTYRVLNTLDALRASMTEAQIGARRYVTLLHPENLDRYREGIQELRKTLPELRQLIGQDPGQLRRLSSVEQLAAGRLATLQSGIDLVQAQGSEVAQHADQTNGRRLYDEFSRAIDGMKLVETSSLKERQARGHQAAIAAETTVIIGGFLAIFVAGSALIAIRREFAARTRAEGALRRAKAELELRVAERTSELRGIVESSNDAIITKTLDGIITSWNPAAQRIFGHSAQQAIGQSMQLIIPVERSAEQAEFLARLAHGERVDHFETVRLRADGTLIDISATVAPLTDGTGRIIGASKIASDITERKAHERKVQAQLERLNLLQQITRAIDERRDLESIYQVVTHSLEEQMPVDFACIANYESASETIQIAYGGTLSGPLVRELQTGLSGKIAVQQNGLGGCTRGELVYEPDISASTFEFPSVLARAGHRALVLIPLSSESKVFALMIAARRKPSSFTSADCEFLSQLSDHLALAAHQAELHSSLQRAYDDLRQTQNAVMQQERLRALGQMASGVAHDINNALAPPALYVQMLLEHDKSLSSEAREYLEIIERSLDDVASTIGRLRKFYGTRDNEVNVSTVDVNQLLQQVAELTRVRWSTMPQRNGLVIELKRELAPSSPRIMGAESEIRDALTNLILNAVDAMPRGGTLALRSRILTSEGTHRIEAAQRVAIEVRDNGVGMTEAVRTRCLEPFFTTKGERGTGLGLAMVYGMAQRHGADLEIDSRPEVGTTMRLIFPAATLDHAPEAAPAVRAPSPMHILIVDDDPLVLTSLRNLMERDGHSVVTADGGRQGIELFLAARERAEPFAIVFTDLGMPNVDGRLVAKEIKASAPETPVVLITGWGQRLQDEVELPDHIDRVLSKPPKLTELRAALAQLASS
jgi:PAS domain S-box-containing protein